MPSAKPKKAPTLDAANMVAGGTPAAQKFPDWKQWVEGSSEYATVESGALYPVVKANALYLDAIKADLDDHRTSDLARHQTINQRLAALEAAVQSPPFPG